MKLILRIARDEGLETSPNGELRQKARQLIRGNDKCGRSATVEEPSRGITATLKGRSGRWKAKPMLVLDTRPRVAKSRASEYQRQQKQRGNNSCKN